MKKIGTRTQNRWSTDLKTALTLGLAAASALLVTACSDESGIETVDQTLSGAFEGKPNFSFRDGVPAYGPAELRFQAQFANGENSAVSIFPSASLELRTGGRAYFFRLPGRIESMQSGEIRFYASAEENGDIRPLRASSHDELIDSVNYTEKKSCTTSGLCTFNGKTQRSTSCPGHREIKNVRETFRRTTVVEWGTVESTPTAFDPQANFHTQSEYEQSRKLSEGSCRED